MLATIRDALLVILLAPLAVGMGMVVVLVCREEWRRVRGRRGGA